MDKEELINRIRQLEKNQPNFSLEDVQTEIKKRKEETFKDDKKEMGKT